MLSRIHACALLSIIVFVGLASCSRNDQTKTISLPPTPIAGAQTRWAVVNSPRLRLREQPTVDSNAIITLFQGYEVEIVNRSDAQQTIADETDYWYYINYKGLRGWVFGYYLTVFDSKQRADAAAKDRSP